MTSSVDVAPEVGQLVRVRRQQLRAAVVVEDRYSKLFTLEHVRAAVVADALAEVQMRWPSVPIVFCETRKLAEDYTYRFLAAAFAELTSHADTAHLEDTLAAATPLPPVTPSSAEIRAWARTAGLVVSDRGRLRPEILDAYRDTHPGM